MNNGIFETFLDQQASTVKKKHVKPYMWFITTVCEMVSDILGHQKFYLSKVDIFENLNKGILDVLI